MVVPGALGQNEDIWFEEMVSVVFEEQILPCQLSPRTRLTKAHTSKVSQLVLHAVAFLLCKAEDSNLTDLTIHASTPWGIALLHSCLFSIHVQLQNLAEAVTRTADDHLKLLCAQPCQQNGAKCLAHPLHLPQIW